MAEGPIDLAHCRILISNDDGIESPGITASLPIADRVAALIGGDGA